jgi:hypothetical protein
LIGITLSSLAMSDYLIIRGIQPARANNVLGEWAKPRRWAREADVRRAWDPQELFINGRNAIRLMKGKHKQELAELVLLLAQHGASAVHVMLRDDQRLEVDLGEWAGRITNRGNGPASH